MLNITLKHRGVCDGRNTDKLLYFISPVPFGVIKQVDTQLVAGNMFYLILIRVFYTVIFYISVSHAKAYPVHIEK